jgi:hypothetical protein
LAIKEYISICQGVGILTDVRDLERFWRGNPQGSCIKKAHSFTLLWGFTDQEAQGFAGTRQ